MTSVLVERISVALQWGILQTNNAPSRKAFRKLSKPRMISLLHKGLYTSRAGVHATAEIEHIDRLDRVSIWSQSGDVRVDHAAVRATEANITGTGIQVGAGTVAGAGPTVDGTTVGRKYVAEADAATFKAHLRQPNHSLSWPYTFQWWIRKATFEFETFTSTFDPHIPQAGWVNHQICSMPHDT